MQEHICLAWRCDAGRFNIVFTMKEVQFLSSAGIGELIERQKTCKQGNRGELVVAEVPDKIKEVLDMTGITRQMVPFRGLVGAGFLVLGIVILLRSVIFACNCLARHNKGGPPSARL
jgi:anti-anti-sigma factor